MTENNLENKAKFFALYWGQKILFQKDGLGVKSNIQAYWERTLGSRFIELKPLERISNDDVKEIMKIENFIGDFEEILVDDSFLNLLLAIKNGLCNRFHIIDYLRSKGYALPWMNLSVDDLVEYGWIKLKSELK